MYKAKTTATKQTLTPTKLTTQEKQELLYFLRQQQRSPENVASIATHAVSAYVSDMAVLRRRI